MNSEIVKKRLDSVFAVDATAESKEDFLATHIPVDQLFLFDSWQQQINTFSDSKKYSEEEIYEEYVKNPNNIHQFIAVYGEAGTGKSHLIRWFKEKFEQDKPENEVVLFLSRNDNSLKGAIKQLLTKPEIQNLVDKNVLEKLTRATRYIDPKELKDLIYYNFVIKINKDLEVSQSTYDELQRSSILKATTKRNLPAFLKDDYIRLHLLREDGPINNIFLKIAEQTIQVDVEAKFTAEDFHISADIERDMNKYSDIKAKKLAKKLREDEKGQKLAEDIATYLNEFVEEVIQSCAGIEPTDFELLFVQIREHLYNEGKNLTVFIEDITATTGINKALLGALMTEHRAVENKKICRISSIIGSTSAYFQNDVRDNYLQRVTKYVYIPVGVFEENKIYEFVGRYLNVLSLEEQQLKNWVENGSVQEDYPIHILKEGKEWDTYEINGISLNLYPFTKKAIMNFYNNKLEQKTPRFIIRDMIRPVVYDAIYNKESFPESKYTFKSGIVNTALSTKIRAIISDASESERLFRFMSIWGNAKNEQITQNGIKLISGLKESFYTDFGLPIIDLNEVVNLNQVTEKIVVDQNVQPIVEETNLNKDVLTKSFEKINSLINYLDEWINGKEIDISNNRGNSGIIRKAIEDIDSFIAAAINWQLEGLSLDIKDKFLTKHVVTLDQISREAHGHIKLPCNRDSVDLLVAFAKWREYGKCSWNYEEANQDFYIVSKWFFMNKNKIISYIKNSENYKYDYVKYALAAEIYRFIFQGQLSKNDFSVFTPELFFKEDLISNIGKYHTKKWYDLIEWMTENNKSQKNIEVIKNTYNLRQGIKKSNRVVINYTKMQKDIKEILKLFEKQTLIEYIPNSDEIKLRLDVCKYYRDLRKKVEEVINYEVADIMKSTQKICTAFEIDYDEKLSVDDLEELIESIEEFYHSCKNAQMNIEMPNLKDFEGKELRISDTISKLNFIVENKLTYKSLYYLSKDPLKGIVSLNQLLNKLDNDLKIVNNYLKNSDSKFDNEIIKPEQKYKCCIESLENSLVTIEKLEELYDVE